MLQKYCFILFLIKKIEKLRAIRFINQDIYIIITVEHKKFKSFQVWIKNMPNFIINRKAKTI